MKEIDDIDTAPIVTRQGARVEYRSVLAEPGADVEIVLDPEISMTDPVMFLSTNPRNALVSVRRMVRGEELLSPMGAQVMLYKFGLPTKGIASRESPIRIFLTNQDVHQVRIGASLVVDEVSRTACSPPDKTEE